MEHGLLPFTPIHSLGRPLPNHFEASAYVPSRYSTIAADSNIFTPVLGSSRYGTWNVPVRARSSSRLVLPQQVGQGRSGRGRVVSGVDKAFGGKAVSIPGTVGG